MDTVRVLAGYVSHPLSVTMKCCPSVIKEGENNVKPIFLHHQSCTWAVGCRVSSRSHT